MNTGVRDEFELMKHRIRSTHLHDNDGKEDSHLYPGEGTIDWKSSMRLMGAQREQYPLLLELKEPAGVEHPIEKAKTAVDKLIEYLNDDNEQ